MTILIGIAGALLGGFLGGMLGVGGITGINVVSILTAIAGAILLLFLYRAIKK